MLKPDMLTTGLPGLDRALKGVIAGDNIVWRVDDMQEYLTFVQPFCAAARRNGRTLVYFRFASHPPLLPDDAGCRNALWQLFNDFYIAGHPVVMTGLYPPRELPHIDDHLVSRLLWGLVARVDVSDDHSRRMILKKVADDRQVGAVVVAGSQPVDGVGEALAASRRHALGHDARAVPALAP
ncbi:MAG TPA: DnaA/Hda family protein, partial [Armatimonadota bacterium]|nr:DnaA/Hda family protein [Armatimonadota bacterium]